MVMRAGGPPVTWISSIVRMLPSLASMVMRARPLNLAGASTVNVPRPPAPIVTGRGWPSTVIATPVAFVGLPKASCAEIGDARRFAAGDHQLARAGGDRELRWTLPRASRRPCRIGWRAAPPPSRSAPRRRSRVAGAPRTGTAPRPARPHRAGGAGRRTRPASAGSELAGVPSGSTATRTISEKLPTSSVGGASTSTRGNGACCRSTSVSRAAPLWSTARAMPARIPGGTWIGISTRPCRSATTGPKLRSATRIVTEAPGLV